MYFSIFYHSIFYLCQLDKETIQDMYKKMTLLNTMDRILYESQRQVRLTVCQVNLSKTSTKKYHWISIKEPPLGEPASGRLMEVTTIGEHLEGWPKSGCSHLMEVQIQLIGV